MSKRKQKLTRLQLVLMGKGALDALAAARRKSGGR